MGTYVMVLISALLIVAVASFASLKADLLMVVETT
jgi:hypothetical protein